MLALITVDSLLDNDDGDKTTLREAIQAANFNPIHDIIDFSTDPADGLNGGTIVLTQGELRIIQSVTIDATMLPSGLTIDAGGNDQTPALGDGSRVFRIVRAADILELLVDLNGLRLTGGDLPTGADPRGGGAISCQMANLTIKNSVITGNSSQAEGGGIWAERSNLTIERTQISGNSSGLDGGGI